MNARARGRRATEFTEKHRYRAVMEAAVVLHEAGLPISEACNLVDRRRDPQIWKLQNWGMARRALCIALMERHWTVESVCAAMRADPRTVRKWLVGAHGEDPAGPQ